MHFKNSLIFKQSHFQNVPFRPISMLAKISILEIPMESGFLQLKFPLRSRSKSGNRTVGDPAVVWRENILKLAQHLWI